MSDLTDLLHRLAEAIHRPADHPLDELSAAVDALEGAPGPAATAAPVPPAEPSDPDTPAPVFTAAPAPFGTETAPEGASFPAPTESD